MNTIEKSRVKNAPLVSNEDRSDFVSWATSIPDGSISAGWQSLHAHLAGNQDDARVSEMSMLEEGDALDSGTLNGRAKSAITDASRRSLAKFVELSRRKLGQSLERLADSAGVDLGELLAVETGEGGVHAQTVQRLAAFLGVNSQRLLQLAGLVPADNHELEQAALHFAALIESVKPLEPQEEAALVKFHQEVFAESSGV
jgi:transcriptional regulator with XRE-family HTH domain